jgi:rod shape-determining protein MreD
MTPSRAVVAAVVLGTALVLQPAVVAPLRLPGGAPQLVVVALVLVALLDGPFTGAVAGFCVGLTCDLLSRHLLGESALVLTLVGWAVGKLAEDVDRSVLVPLGVVAVASAVAVLGIGVVAALTNDGRVGVAPVLRSAGAAALYGLVLTPFLYPPVRALWDRLGPRPVP